MRRFALAVAFAAAALVAACKPAATPVPSGPTTAPATLAVLAGSELKDLEPLLPQVRAATGIDVVFTYAGTLDAVDRLQAGERFDAAWLASNRYALLVDGVRARVVAQERIMTTPVVLGLKESKARELGWAGNADVTWADIARAAGERRFTFAMTNPASSNTGFSALLGLAAALSGKSDALDAADVDPRRLAAFFSAQSLTAGSSGWLAEAYVKDQARIDGMINYANTLLSLNRSGQLREKLVLVAPKDGVISADYPLMLLAAERRPEFDRLTAYLKSTAFQQAMQKATLRRPVNPDVAVEPDVAALGTLLELAFPARREVVDAVLVKFDSALRKPGDATFVLDTSGSMKGERIGLLHGAMVGLLQGDSSLTGRFAQFRPRERITVLSFASSPRTPITVELGVDAAQNGAALLKLNGVVDRLRADGGTAIFDATRRAYEQALRRRGTDRERFYTIVLLTDGENTHGSSVESFVAWYNALPEDARGIRVFPVLFGEARPKELATLADLTGGRVFDGRHGSLAAVFRDIRGYQ